MSKQPQIERYSIQLPKAIRPMLKQLREAVERCSPQVAVTLWANAWHHDARVDVDNDGGSVLIDPSFTVVNKKEYDQYIEDTQALVGPRKITIKPPLLPAKLQGRCCKLRCYPLLGK